MAASSSSESDSSSSRSTSPEPANQQKQAVKATKTKEPENNDESSSSGSESESGSGSDSSSDDNGAETTSSKQPANKVSISTPQTYKPPTGFKTAKKQTPPSSKTSSLLSNSNLNGKQVFHITAPSFLPLSKVKEVSMAKIIQGEPILTHEGVNYGIPTETLLSESAAGPEGKALLVYDQTSQTYRSAAGNIPTYHIQEMIGLLPGTSKGTTDKTVKALRDEPKPRRRQPKHLKMRFRPVGSFNGPPETIGESSESEVEEEPTFKVPQGGEREEQRKRKHHQEGNATIPRKKLKKHDRDGEVGGHKKSKKSHKDKEEKKRKKAEKA